MLTENDKRALAFCQKRLAKPKWKFVLIQGVLYWGLPIGIMLSLVRVWVHDQTYRDLLRKDLWVSILFYGTGGIALGMILRWIINKQYARLKDKESSIQ